MLCGGQLDWRRPVDSLPVMAKGTNETPVLVLALLITLGLIGGGFWFFRRAFTADSTSSPIVSPTAQPTEVGGSTGDAGSGPTLDVSLPNPSVLTMDGSVTLVALMKQLQLAYTQVNPALPTTYGVPDGQPNGTNAGIQNLLNGTVLLAASSRPLTAEEKNAGLQAFPIARDALAVAVGIDNPFKGGLTLDQLKQIYQGQITNWSQVGGPDVPIKVINRAVDSGTRTFFQDVVLLEEPFAPDGPNFMTLERDETTPMLRALGTNGIGYSTVQQIENQQTVRLVPINGVSPADRETIRNGSYPITRVTYLVTQPRTSPAVQQFIDLARSPQGQQIVERMGFVALP